MIGLQVAVTVEHGQLTEERRILRELLRGRKDGNYVLSIRPFKGQRSLDQNAYLHAVPFPILAEHFGYTIPEVKLVLMGECFGWHLVGGRELPIKPSTAEMTTEEATYFIDWLIPWAAMNHHVEIPLPNEWAA